MTGSPRPCGLVRATEFLPISSLGPPAHVAALAGWPDPGALTRRRGTESAVTPAATSPPSPR